MRSVVSDRDLLLVHVRGYGAEDQRLSNILLLCIHYFIVYDNVLLCLKVYYA